jgi:hypothetical protein
MSTSLYNKIKVTLEFSGRSVTSEIPPYKTIKYLKELTKTLFYPIQGEVNLIYQNKDITKYGQFSLGEYFKNKNQIFIKVVKQNKIIKEINRENDNNKYISIELEKNSEFLCHCKNDLINNYCRNCKLFICNYCRNNKIHKYHRTIQIETNNLVESTKLYAITLQSEILSNIRSSQDYYKKFQNNNFIDAFSRQEIIKRKYENVYEIYQNILNELKIYENNESDISDYINKAKKENQEIEGILTEIHIKYNYNNSNKTKRMTQNEFNNYFYILGEKEDKLENMSSKIYAIRINYEINEKLNEINEQIESILDKVLNEKNLLGIDDTTMNIYNLILKKNREKEENNENNEYEEKEEMQALQKEIIEQPKKIDPIKKEIKEKDQKLRKLRKVKNKDLLQEAEKNQLVSIGVLNAKSQPDIILVDNIKNDNLDSNLTQNMDNYMNDLPLSYNINVDKSKKLFDSAEISMIHKNDEEDVNKKKLEDELFLEPEEKEDNIENNNNNEEEQNEEYM